MRFISHRHHDCLTNERTNEQTNTKAFEMIVNMARNYDGFFFRVTTTTPSQGVRSFPGADVCSKRNSSQNGKHVDDAKTEKLVVRL